MVSSRWFLDQHIFNFIFKIHFAPRGTTSNMTFLNTQNRPTLLSLRKTSQCSLYFNSVYCVHTQYTPYNRIIMQYLQYQQIYIKKCNIQISPSFLTLPAFYQLVCYTVLIEAMCAAIFLHETTTTVCLGNCFHTSSMVLS